LVFGYLLLALLPIAAIVYILWDHRRKAAQRELASADRLRELMGATPQPVRAERTEPIAAAASALAVRAVAEPAQSVRAEPTQSVRTEPAPSVRAEPTAAAPAYAVRARLLSPPQTLVYYLLRTGLPDHLIFARVTLASVLDAGPDVPGYARNEQIRRLAGHTVDFVVSDKSMKPVAVLKLNAPGGESGTPGENEPARTWLAMAGVRYVELDSAALPRKEGIRALVLGDGAPAGSGEATAQAAT
jgi:hypothetical protein